jgi:excisionase family DNA binding protein
MVMGSEEWLSLGEASARLGVHPNTMRRWADAGSVPCYRTPGGHRRFRASELRAVLVVQDALPPASPADALIQQAITHTRERLAARPLHDEPWQAAFPLGTERQQMREMGHQLLGLVAAIVRGGRATPPMLAEGRRIGAWYGERCAGREMSLVNTARSFCFFRTSVLQATSRAWAVAADMGEVAARTALAAFLDEVMYACLASYEAARRGVLPPEDAA